MNQIGGQLPERAPGPAHVWSCRIVDGLRRADSGADNAPSMPERPLLPRFEQLLRQYGRLVSSAVGRVAGRASPALRQDIEQDVLLALWKQVERAQVIEHPGAYFYRAAVRETVRALRRERRRQSEPLPENGEGVAERATPAGDPQAQLERRELAEHLERALAQLAPERARAVRAHLAGFSVHESMAMFGWSYQKARNLVARGLADLRGALRERGIHA